MARREITSELDFLDKRSVRQIFPPRQKGDDRSTTFEASLPPASRFQDGAARSGVEIDPAFRQLSRVADALIFWRVSNVSFERGDIRPRLGHFDGHTCSGWTFVSHETPLH
jgi:hypothetical protein